MAASLGAAAVALAVAAAPASAADLTLGAEVFENNCGKRCASTMMGVVSWEAWGVLLLGRRVGQKGRCPWPSMSCLPTAKQRPVPSSHAARAPCNRALTCVAAVCHAGGLNNIAGEEKHTLKRDALEKYKLYSEEAIAGQVRLIMIVAKGQFLHPSMLTMCALQAVPCG